MDGSMIRRSVASEGDAAGVCIAMWMRGLTDIENDVWCVQVLKGLDGRERDGKGKGMIIKNKRVVAADRGKSPVSFFLLAFFFCKQGSKCCWLSCQSGALWSPPCLFVLRFADTTNKATERSTWGRDLNKSK